ncbi:CRISPR-associated protein Cmr3 [Candidatus Poribacteria bacterium]|nr:CRISPR-associated protein Cmr3 [Candidatus Poribacteria bacterium]
MTTFLELTCRDPIVSRDGRPFGVGQGNRMKSVGWLLPSVVAGSLRTMIGKAAGRDFSDATAKDLLQMSVAGVFPVADGRLYYPAPNDCVVEKPDDGAKPAIHQGKLEAIRDGEGCDLPGGLAPVTLKGEDFKPGPKPDWWRDDHYAKWLVTDEKDFAFDETFLQAPCLDERTHVSLDPAAGAAAEGELFTTAALAATHLPRYGAKPDDLFSRRFAEIRLTARVVADGWCGEKVEPLNGVHPLGGERRLVHWRSVAEMASKWKCPPAVADTLSKKPTRLRMVLATPAIFCGGWKPGWLDAELRGTPPGASMTLQLKGVCIERWRAVSGWSLAEPRGPKPVKRMVPAGGVYFFDVVAGDASGLAERWLEPVSDDEQDRRNGFGLALWGVA